MKKLRIKTPAMELEVQDVPSWLVLVVIIAGAALLLAGVSVWA